LKKDLLRMEYPSTSPPPKEQSVGSLVYTVHGALHHPFRKQGMFEQQHGEPAIFGNSIHIFQIPYDCDSTRNGRRVLGTEVHHDASSMYSTRLFKSNKNGRNEQLRSF
jgi:hypothetical protein